MLDRCKYIKLSVFIPTGDYTPSFSSKIFNLRRFYINNNSMKIKIKILQRNVLQEIEVTNGITVSELLQKIQLGSGPFVVLKNNVIIPSDYVLNNDTDLSILQVISGG